MKLPIKVSIADLKGQVAEFEKLETLVSFIKSELKFWKEKENQLKDSYGYQPTYVNVQPYFQNILDIIGSWKAQISTWDESVFTNHINSLNASHIAPLTGLWIWSGRPFIKTWIESYKISQAAGDGFIQAILKRQTPHITSYEWLKGYLLAYEFELQDESSLSKRRLSEEEAFDHLRQELLEKKTELIGDVSTFQADMETWRKGEELAITTLKNTYEEKLRLEGAATYWNIRARECKEQGENWAGLLGATIFVAGVIFVSLMAAWLKAYNTGLQLNTLEGAIIFASILSLFAFAIKVLSKLTFSSFHLQRDAEEREQLTYLYLALANENKVDEESRSIVLQALFSRSETGLLASENGPTMPTVQDAIKAIRATT